MADKKEKTITVTQTRSGIGYSKRQKDTLQCLGLGKIGRTVVHNDQPSVRGMLRKVSHLVEIELSN